MNNAVTMYMDRNERLNNFGLFNSLVSNGASLVNVMVLEAEEKCSHHPEAIWLLHALPVGDLHIPGHLIKSFLFNKTCSHISKFNAAFIVPQASPGSRSHGALQIT